MTATISHRELRNNSADALRRVAAGESIIVTNNGDPAAMLVPIVGTTPFDHLVAAGRVRPPTSGEPFVVISAVQDGPSTAQVLDDLRDER